MIESIRTAIAQAQWMRSIVFRLRYHTGGNRSRFQGEKNHVDCQLSPGLPRLKSNSIQVTGHHNSIMIGPNTNLAKLQVLVQGTGNRIVIESGCHIASGSLWIQANNAELTIGKGTTIVNANIGIAIDGARLIIGEDCMLSHGIDIRCGDSHSIIDLTTGKQLNWSEQTHIIIKNHVWLGMHTCVLKDVTIGENSIIAAGSIVTKSIPRNCIAAGVPARVKRQKVTWSRQAEASLAQISTPLNRVNPIRVLHTLVSDHSVNDHSLIKHPSAISPREDDLNRYPMFLKLQNDTDTDNLDLPQNEK